MPVAAYTFAARRADPVAIRGDTAHGGGMLNPLARRDFLSH
jgi:hypothetical protein